MDTDFEEYMIIYSCQDFAEFTENGETLTDQQAWERRKNVK